MCVLWRKSTEVHTFGKQNHTAGSGQSEEISDNARVGGKSDWRQRLLVERDARDTEHHCRFLLPCWNKISQ